MAEKRVLVDDLDETTVADVERVSFAYGKTQYEIDLSPEHRRLLETALEPFITHGRKVRAPKPKQGAATRPGDELSDEAMRRWARERGIEVPQRGPVGKVRDAYAAAHTTVLPHPNAAADDAPQSEPART
ncbi:Lsr2 family protein (plasmid) [Streptomycetaceae bacterium NBC_01309]